MKRRLLGKLVVEVFRAEDGLLRVEYREVVRMKGGSEETAVCLIRAVGEWLAVQQKAAVVAT